LEEYDWDGQKLGELPEIDVRNARDLRVTADGSVYVCCNQGADSGIAFRKYSPDRTVSLCRGLNVISLRLAVDGKVFAAGERVPVKAVIENREKMYGITLPGLDEIERALWLRPHRPDAPWRRLAIGKADDGTDYLELPQDVAGACELCLSASPAAARLIDGAAASVSVNIAIRDPRVTDGTITLCADRGQEMLAAGEWLRATVVGRSINGVPAEQVAVQLVDPAGKTQAELTASWAIPANSNASVPVDVRLPSGCVPGEWSLRAKSPALGEARLDFTVSSPRESGRFKMFTALCLGQKTSDETARALVRIAARNGITHDVTRYISAGYEFGWWENDLGANRGMRALLAADPRLPAPESAELPSRMRSALHEMGAAGMHFWPEVMGWELDTVNRTDKQKIDDAFDLARWTQWGIKSPSQDGYLWNESNWWGIDQDRLKKEWSQASGKPVESLDGIKWGQLREQNPLLTGDKLAAALSYHEFAAKHLYPDNYAKWRQFVRTMRPGSLGVGMPAVYWFNWPEWCSAPLDAVVSYHQVEQVCEPWMQLNDCAFMKHDGKPFYAGVEMAPEPGTGEYIARQLLPALLYGAEGFWANEMSGIDRFISGQGRSAARMQAAGDLQAVLEPVGTRLRDTAYRPQLGIYYPRTGYVQGGNPAFRGAMYHKRISAALIASFHAHVPATVVFDEDIKAGRFGNLKYLLIPGLQSDITSDDMASLERFKAKGGMILLGRNCAEQYALLGTALDVDFDIFQDYDYFEWFANDTIVEKRLKVIALAGQMQKALAPFLKPPVQIDDPEVWFALREGKDNRGRPVTWLIAVNQNYPNLQPHQLWKMTSAYDVIMPVMRTAKVPGQFRYGYDILRGSDLRIRNGELALDFRRFPAVVIALSDERLRAEDLRERDYTPAVKPGKPSVRQAPDADVFSAADIIAALRSGQKIHVIGREKERATVVDALANAGLPAEPSANVEQEAGVHVVLPLRGDGYWNDDKDMLPLRLTEDVPGPGRAMISYTRAYLPGSRDAIVVAAVDDAGLAKAVQTLISLKSSTPAPDDRLTPPAMLPAAPAPLDRDVTGRWGARLTAVRAAGDTVAVGAAEWGNNLFILNARNGKLRAAAKAGRYYVDNLQITPDGDTIGAEAMYPEDVNAYLELFDDDEKSIARFARDGIDSHANRSFFNHTRRRDVFSFAMSPDGSMVYSGSNAGLSAIRRNGTVLWRHDYSAMQNGLDLLRNKWAAMIDLTPDGKRLAVGLTHEIPVEGRYRGSSIVRVLDAATGKIVWQKELEPITAPHISAVAISPDGSTVAIVGHDSLFLLRDGGIVRQRTAVSMPTWSRDSQTLFVLARREGYSAGENGIIALDRTGVPRWQFEQPEPIISIAVADAGGLVIADAACRIIRIAADGQAAWTASTDAVASVCTSADSAYACDWHGNVCKLAMADGKLLWTTNLTGRVWRDDIEQLPAKPYAGKTFGVHPRRPVEQPLDGENIAPQAKVTAGGEQGWFASGKVHIDAKTLVDGQTNDLPGPWLGIVDQYKSDNWGRLVWAELAWPQEVELAGLAIHEDERHSESWPYDCCVQVWKDDAWQDAAVSLMNPVPWHNLRFDAPVKVQKIRYWVTSILSNNVWTDEIRAIKAK
ncbi:MAG TPA: PQQ-binding-like beta-propeller repeat protein, partial [Planctomycetota bacterium]|nr:PQQ-binding-like beta-propeller repeat protein [Planctomycetota bacterium]